MADVIISDGIDGSIFIDNTVGFGQEIYGADNISFPIEFISDFIDNTNTIPNDSTVNFVISSSIISNTSTSYGASIQFVILPNVITNTSTMYGVPFIDILSRNISVNVISNTNSVPDPEFMFPYAVDIIDNSSTVFGNSDIILDIFVLPDVITNVNKMSPSIIGFKDIPVVGTEVIRKTQNLNIKNNFLFSDFSYDFLPHPVTGDIARLYDVDAINQSLNNILKTRKFERPFEHYNVSSQIRSLLFALSDNLMATELRSEVFQAIVNNEPRINIIDIIVESTPDKHELFVKILYKIKTFDKVNTFKTIITRT